MAQLAGLRLRERWGGWRREPFTSESEQYVSVWEKPRASRTLLPGSDDGPARVRRRPDRQARRNGPRSGSCGRKPAGHLAHER
jgi:hypothetical protein